MQGKVALVTGAGGGIGRASAVELAKRGASVIVHYNSSVQSAQDTVQAIEAAGGKAVPRQCDIRSFTAAGEMISSIIEEYGRLDVLVNNAGITRDGLLIGMKEEDFDCVLDTNLKGTFNCMRHCVRQMLKQRSGRIINISSVSGVVGNAGQANYSASKAGIIGLTRSAAREFAARGITVNAIAPGFIDTDMSQAMTDAAKEATIAQIPLKRIGKPEDIAETAAFLASDKASYITGQVISVDGGMAI